MINMDYLQAVSLLLELFAFIIAFLHTFKGEKGQG